MNDTITDVITWLTRHLPRDPDYTACSIRMHPDTIAALNRQAHTGTTGPSGYGMHAIVGLALIPDDTLPPGVWRTCTADGRLIYDSRTGRTQP